jgi:hypothetical protein
MVLEAQPKLVPLSVFKGKGLDRAKDAVDFLDK